MKKTKIIIIGIAAFLILAAIGTWQLLTVDSPERAGLNHLNVLHMRLNPADIPFLIEVVRKNSDQYVRERAIFIMTDIAVRKDAAEQVSSFLDDLAYNEKNDSVRSAAYTNLYVIRELDPLKIDTNFDAYIEGNIFEGNTVDLVASVNSGSQVNEAIVGIKRITRRETGGAQGIRVSTPNPLRFSLKAGEIKESRFSLDLRDEGEYLLLCFLKLSIDRVDYQTWEKAILLRVEKTGGSYQVQE